MAHNAQLADLTAALIASLTDRQSTKLRAARALRSLKEHNFARTNQFAVQSALDGLNEKFIVLGRDDLADGLTKRLPKLPSDDKLLPDKLALLLSLSDRPYLKVSVDEVVSLSALPVAKAEDLTWPDIISDEPLDGDIWQNIERGHHSSEDDLESSDAVSTTSTDNTSSGSSPWELAQSYLVSVDSDEQSSQSARHAPSVGLTELDLARATLLMLRGFATTLYHADTTGVVRNKEVHLNHATSPTLLSLIDDFASVGSKLLSLQRWSKAAQSQPHIRTIQAETIILLRAYHADVAMEEHRLIRKDTPVTFSLVKLLSATRRRTESIVRLSAICQTPYTAQFGLLDALLEEACSACALDQHVVFETLARLFIAGIATYFRPVQAWCHHGTLDGLQQDFFIVEHSPTCEIRDVWKSRYATARNERGGYVAPVLIVKHVPAIFALGKQQMLRKLLGCPDTTARSRAVDISVQLDTMLEDVLRDPFRDLPNAIHAMLGSWIGRLTAIDEPSLNHSILHDHGLLAALATYKQLYLCEDSHTFDQLILQLSRCLRRRNQEPGSLGYLLTDKARDAVRSSPHIDTQRISISCESRLTQGQLVSMQHLTLSYRQEWPVEMTLGELLPQSYASIWSLLAQARVAKTRLQAIERLPSGTVATSPMLVRLRFHLLTFIDIVVSHITAWTQAHHDKLVQDLTVASGVNDMIEATAQHAALIAEVGLSSESLSSVRAAMTLLFELCESVGTQLANQLQTGSVSGVGATQLDGFSSRLSEMVEDLRNADCVPTVQGYLHNLADRLDLARVPGT